LKEEKELYDKLRAEREINELLQEKEREMEQKLFEKAWFDGDSSYSFSEWLDTRKNSEEAVVDREVVVEREAVVDSQLEAVVDREPEAVAVVDREQKYKGVLSDMRVDIDVLLKGVLKGDSDVDTPHFGYCKVCFVLLELFSFLEKYSEEIRFEKEFVEFYRVIRGKLDEFSNKLQDMSKTPCKCDEENYKIGGGVVRNLCRIDDMILGPEYAGMAHYRGYGVVREKYRMCYLNFFTVNVADVDYGGEEYYITRDFERVRGEVLHWLKYFEHEHEAVIEEAVTEMEKYMPDDCIGIIKQFL
jgi:hypothetical protein